MSIRRRFLGFSVALPGDHFQRPNKSSRRHLLGSIATFPSPCGGHRRLPGHRKDVHVQVVDPEAALPGPLHCHAN